MIVSINRTHNPYIVGRPIHQNEKLYGRDDVFQFIKEQIKNNEKIIVLYGQRRMGMTSVLHHIPNTLDSEEDIFIPLSLEDKSHKSLGAILYDLERDILDILDLSKKEVSFLKKEQLESDNLLFITQFLAQINQKINNKKIILSIDEFDVLWDEHGDNIHPFIDYLKRLIKQQDNLFIILVVGRKLKNISPLASFFGSFPQKEFKALDKRHTILLITEPTKGILEYTLDAIETIWKLSGGNPYLIQTLCFTIFQQAQETDNSVITLKDVENIIEQAVIISEGGLIGSWDVLSTTEKILLLAVAESQEETINSRSNLESPFILLQKHGVKITPKLIKVCANLVQKQKLKKFVTPGISINQLPQYQVSSELFRKWLLKRYHLSDEISQLRAKGSELQEKS